jgi:hypothetical protein
MVRQSRRKLITRAPTADLETVPAIAMAADQAVEAVLAVLARMAAQDPGETAAAQLQRIFMWLQMEKTAGRELLTPPMATAATVLLPL